MKNILTFINKNDHSIKVCLNTNISIEEFDKKINNLESNKYLDRLKQQYKIAQRLDAPYKWLQELRDSDYQAMRLFCLDCELVSFNDIEIMEYEVNNEVNQSLKS